MTERVAVVASLASGVGALLVAGVFLAFSNFVMPALARLPPQSGVAAMNSINVTVLNPLFMTVLFGTALAGILSAASVGISDRSDWSSLAATTLYLVGCIVVTLAFNVPLNERLAIAGQIDWETFLRDWVRWNTVRALASGAAGTLYLVAAARLA